MVAKVSLSDYRVDIQRKMKTVHANLLKKYMERDPDPVPTAVLSSCSVIEPDSSEGPDGDGEYALETTETHSDVHIGEYLFDQQQEDVRSLLSEFMMSCQIFPIVHILLSMRFTLP